MTARARAIRLAGAAAILPLAVGVPGASPASAQTVAPFAPPAGPMLLIRTTRRPLSGGQEVIMRRTYRIHFRREGDGYRIDGDQIDVSVDAPARLKPLAELELRRLETGLFPAYLDAAGKVSRRALPVPTPEPGGAAEMAAARIRAAPITGFEKEQALAFVAALAERPGLNPWPDDLFHPVPGHRREERVIPLVNGVRGKVTVDIDARMGPGGLLASFARTVSSDLEGDARRVYESWTLAAAPGETPP